MSNTENPILICERLINAMPDLTVLKQFLTNDKFIYPFSSTLGATATILFIQFINRYTTNTKKKIYAISYILDVATRSIESALIIKKNTILPHIEAMSRIIEGDHQLLQTMFTSDEFDILTDKQMKFTVLPDDYKIIIGCDDIELIQSYEGLCYLLENDIKRKELNKFVSENLKSVTKFNSFSHDEQREVLITYSNILDQIEHDLNRLIWLIIYVVYSKINSYLKNYKFIFFSKESIKKLKNKSTQLIDTYDEFLPEPEYMEQVRQGGIQNDL